jgi:ribosomal protein S27E
MSGVNVLFRWIIAHTAAKTRLRACGRCGNEQLVSAGRRDGTTTCKKCGASMPSPRG